jgi:U3 small nucleolar RNA-associated protein 23
MGVPLIYINRSVMIMEPMASSSAETRERGERSKFRDGLKGKERGTGILKRKREDEGVGAGEEVVKKKKIKGPKGPNPLSVKKPKKKLVEVKSSAASEKGEREAVGEVAVQSREADGSDFTVKRKRRRKHKSSTDGGGSV